MCFIYARQLYIEGYIGIAIINEVATNHHHRNCESIKMTDRDLNTEMFTLAREYYEKTGESLLIELSHSFGCITCPHKLYVNKALTTHHSIAEIIEKLKSLFNAQHKFNIGDKVYFVNNNDTEEFIVQEIKNHLGINLYVGEKYPDVFMSYSGSDWEITEDNLFATKRELCEAQIKHWEDIKRD